MVWCGVVMVCVSCGLGVRANLICDIFKLHPPGGKLFMASAITIYVLPESAIKTLPYVTVLWERDRL